MLIDHMRYFIALNDHHSITKTSQAMHTTPQNVSRILKKLETEMNAVLFLRTADGIQLTSAGEEFLDYCKSTVYRFDEMHARFSIKDPQSIQTVTLYSNDFLNEYILNDALVSFAKEHPTILVNNLVVDYAEGFRNLETDPLAIGFLFYNDQRVPYSDKLVIVPACEMHPIFCVSRSHPLTKRFSISKEQLLSYKFVVCSKNNPTDSGTFHFLEIDPLLEQVPIISSSSLRTCYQITANSDYVFFSTQENFLQQDAAIQDNLVALPIHDYPISRSAMIRSVSLPSDSPQQFLFSYILNYIQQLKTATADR